MGCKASLVVLAAMIMVLAGHSVPVRAGDWPQWRGPNHNGISEEKNWNPKALGEQPKILWSVELGEGFSSVSVNGGRVYSMGYRDGKDTVYCLNIKDGKTLWTHSYPCKKGSHAGPLATPVVDGDNVYTSSRQGQMFCLDAAKGTVKWQKQVAKEFQAGRPKWDFAASPRVEGDKLIVNFCKAGVALNKRTGAKIWASAPGIGNYSTPVVFSMNKKRVAAMFGQQDFLVVDVGSGRKLMSFPWKASYDVNAADPLLIGKRVFISSGYGKGCALLDISGGSPRVVWQNTNMSNHFSCSIYLNGYIYGIDGNTGNRKAGVKCLDAKTGSVKWNEALGFGSLMIAGGKLIILNERGVLFIAGASPAGYKEYSQAKIFSARKVRCWTAPVLAQGRVFCRNNIGAGELICVDVSK